MLALLLIPMGYELNFIIRQRRTFLIAQEVHIPRHGPARHTELGHEVRTIGWSPPPEPSLTI